LHGTRCRCCCCCCCMHAYVSGCCRWLQVIRGPQAAQAAAGRAERPASSKPHNSAAADFSACFVLLQAGTSRLRAASSASSCWQS
jgi:hypothetical protein